MLPHQPTLPHRLAALALSWSIRTVNRTLRYESREALHQWRQVNDSPVIFCLWHNRLFLCPMLYRRLKADSRTSRRMAVMVSTSRDGALLSEIFNAFRIHPVRGSTSRLGSRALRELVGLAREGWDIGITPDGPRGPRYQIQQGIVALAQLTELPIVPISYELSGKWTTHSWDRFQIPRPFSRCHIRIAPPLSVPRSLDNAARSQITNRLQEIMNRISVD